MLLNPVLGQIVVFCIEVLSSQENKAAPGAVPVTTPSYFGGEKLIALPGAKITFQKGVLKGSSIDVEGGVPVYQSLNGPLPSEEWRFSFGLNFNF